MAGYFSQRRQKKEIEREVKFKQGLGRIKTYVQKSRDAQKRYWDLAKRALKLGDKEQFNNIAKAYLRTGNMISRWEKYLVVMETISLQRDQVKATGEFAKSLGALTESMMAGASPEDVTKMQLELERALIKANTLDETLAAVMDVTSDTVFSSEGLSEESLQQIEKVLTGEVQEEETGDLDSRIEEGLKSLEEQIKREP